MWNYVLWESTQIITRPYFYCTDWLRFCYVVHNFQFVDGKNVSLHRDWLRHGFSILLKGSYICKSHVSTSLGVIISGHGEQCSLYFYATSVYYIIFRMTSLNSIHGIERGFVQAECCHFIHWAKTMTFFIYLLFMSRKINWTVILL